MALAAAASSSRKRGREDLTSSMTVSASRPSTTFEEDSSASALFDEERSSRLHAPIMVLTGHEGPIYSTKFAPSGAHLASAGAERKILLWEVYGETCENFNVLEGHKNAILELRWVDERHLATASADKTVCLWDTHAGKRKRKWTGHTSFVNAVAATREPNALVASGADDGLLIVWDPRSKERAAAIPHGRAVTAVEIKDDTLAFSGGIDDVVRAWDLRKFTTTAATSSRTTTDQGSRPLYSLEGHQHTITGVALSPDGTTLLSNAMDSKLFTWDVQSFVAGDRRTPLRAFVGARHDFQKNLLSCAWSNDASKVSAGSSDSIVHIWDVASADELYYLPGHLGSVNDVHFHPLEPIVASCGSDNLIYLGEIAP